MILTKSLKNPELRVETVDTTPDECAREVLAEITRIGAGAINTLAQNPCLSPLLCQIPKDKC